MERLEPMDPLDMLGVLEAAREAEVVQVATAKMGQPVRRALTQGCMTFVSWVAMPPRFSLTAPIEAL